MSTYHGQFGYVPPPQKGTRSPQFKLTVTRGGKLGQVPPALQGEPVVIRTAQGSMQFSGSASAAISVSAIAVGLIQFAGDAAAEMTGWRPIALEHEDNTFNEVKCSKLKIGDTELTEQQLIDLLELL